jgi:hypothetical protein
MPNRMDNLPSMVTAALFVAVILSDLMKGRRDSAKGHFFLGIVSFLLILYLHEEGYDMVAWGILSVPFILIVLGIMFGGGSTTQSAPKQHSPTPTQSPGVSPGILPENSSANDCPVPGQIIPAKKQCDACSKGRA